jgi:hypothetical protein
LVGGIGGNKLWNKYLMNLALLKKVGISTMTVTEGNLEKLIGMNVNLCSLKNTHHLLFFNSRIGKKSCFYWKNVLHAAPPQLLVGSACLIHQRGIP